MGGRHVASSQRVDTCPGWPSSTRTSSCSDSSRAIASISRSITKSSKSVPRRTMAISIFASSPTIKRPAQARLHAKLQEPHYAALTASVIDPAFETSSYGRSELGDQFCFQYRSSATGTTTTNRSTALISCSHISIAQMQKPPPFGRGFLA